MNITKLKRAIIKEEYIAITGDMLESVILNQFIYWSERVWDFDKFIKEENERQERYCRPSQGEEPTMQPLLHGWIYKKAAELKDEIMSTDSEKTINRKLSSLVEKGFLDRRNNPKIKYDRTYQYRVNFENIIKALLEKGYILQDYKVDLKFIVEALKTDKGQNDDCSKNKDDNSKGQIDALKNQIVVLKNQIDALKEQGVQAIPKTTTETTPETIPEGIQEDLPKPNIEEKPFMENQRVLIKEDSNNKDSRAKNNNLDTNANDVHLTAETNETLLDKFRNLVKTEVSEVSYKTWIEPLSIRISNKKAIIETKDNFYTRIIKDRFSLIIKESLEMIGLKLAEIKEREEYMGGAVCG